VLADHIALKDCVVVTLVKYLLTICANLYLVSYCLFLKRNIVLAQAGASCSGGETCMGNSYCSFGGCVCLAGEHAENGVCVANNIGISLI
jgi:hypothetical protein